MSEKNDHLPEETVNAEEKQENTDLQRDFAKKMQAIASDLWGSLSGGAAAFVTDRAAEESDAAGRKYAQEGRTAGDTVKPDGPAAGLKKADKKANAPRAENRDQPGSFRRRSPRRTWSSDTGCHDRRTLRPSACRAPGSSP